MNFIVVLLGSWFLFLGMASASWSADVDKNQAGKAVPLPVELKVVEKWRGTWDVKAMRRQPQPAGEVTYTETFDWVLDGRYLRSETSRKSDGDKSISMFWYDMLTKSYRYVIYSASGLAVELPPPTWSEGTQTMEWKTGMLSPLSYNGFATFTDPNTIRWKSLWKDWKGTVIFDLEGTSFRRK
jgi:hypothetical protein